MIIIDCLILLLLLLWLPSLKIIAHAWKRVTTLGWRELMVVNNCHIDWTVGGYYHRGILESALLFQCTVFFVTTWMLCLTQQLPADSVSAWICIHAYRSMQWGSHVAAVEWGKAFKWSQELCWPALSRKPLWVLPLPRPNLSILPIKLETNNPRNLKTPTPSRAWTTTLNAEPEIQKL